MNDEDLKRIREIEKRVDDLKSYHAPSLCEVWKYMGSMTGSIQSIVMIDADPPFALTGDSVAELRSDRDRWDALGEFISNGRIDVPYLLDLVKSLDKRARHAEAERDAFDKRIEELEAEVTRLKSNERTIP